MNESTKATLELLARVLPTMGEMKKAWLLGFVEGAAGEPFRQNQRDAPDGGAAVQVRPGA